MSVLRREYPSGPDSAVLPAVVPDGQVTHQTVSLRRSGEHLHLFVGTGRATFTAEQADRLIAELQRLRPEGNA